MYRYTKKIEISRQCKKEMKILREMHNDHVNTFMGLIVHAGGYGVSVGDEQCVCLHGVQIVRELCAKGSLFDILINENITIDHVFVASFVQDLIKGMLTHVHRVYTRQTTQDYDTCTRTRWRVCMAISSRPIV
jgi:hypothetical protein